MHGRAWPIRIHARRAALTLLTLALPLSARSQSLRLPPTAGMTLVQTLSSPFGDRESVHTVREATGSALRWSWQVVEVQPAGDTIRQHFRYAELRDDVAEAIRFRAFHEVDEPEEHPGYTMHALSRAVYRRLRATGSDTFQIMTVESSGAAAAALGFGPRARAVRWSGTLAVVSQTPVALPLLVNGKRTTVPALHVRGRFRWRAKQWEPQLWFLADSSYPMLLKWVGAHAQETNVLQTTRLDVPTDLGTMERELTAACRAELPGVYFGFNSAVLDSASERSLAQVAALLAKYPTWKLTIEGHTDSVGTAAANQALSERRVDAVRARLVSGHRVGAARLAVKGYGSTRQRESNATIEGRARNRRVELVRSCEG